MGDVLAVLKAGGFPYARRATTRMAYTVHKAADIRRAGDVLVSLWSRSLQMRGEPRDKYHWYYLGNPLNPADAFILTHVDSPSGSPESVGCCGVGVRRLSVDGRHVQAGLFADFAVDKAHRTVMPALMLQRALCAHVTKTYDLGYGFPNGAAVGIFGRVGFPLLGQMGRFVKVLRFSHFLKRRMPAPLAAVAGAALDTASALRDRLTSLVSTGKLAWVDDVDDRFDQLWEVARGKYPIIGERTSQFLRWRFVTRPGLRSHIATLQDHALRLRAYAVVLEKDPGVALITDFLAASDNDLRTLLRRLSLGLRARGFHSAVVLFLGTPSIRELLESEGFQFRNLAKFVVVGVRAPTVGPTDRAPAEASGGAAALEEARLRRTEDWYLTEADRDN